LHTRNPKDVLASGGLEMLREAPYEATYLCDALVVFLRYPVLEKCVLIDCPGVGTSKEAKHSRNAGASDIVRERRLQTKASCAADAFVVLSAAVGGGGAFSADKTAAILREVLSCPRSILVKGKRHPWYVKQGHGHILPVVSQADPSREHLADADGLTSAV